MDLFSSVAPWLAGLAGIPLISYLAHKYYAKDSILSKPWLWLCGIFSKSKQERKVTANEEDSPIIELQKAPAVDGVTDGSATKDPKDIPLKSTAPRAVPVPVTKAPAAPKIKTPITLLTTAPETMKAITVAPTAPASPNVMVANPAKSGSENSTAAKKALRPAPNVEEPLQDELATTPNVITLPHHQAANAGSSVVGTSLNEGSGASSGTGSTQTSGPTANQSESQRKPLLQADREVHNENATAAHAQNPSRKNGLVQHIEKIYDIFMRVVIKANELLTMGFEKRLKFADFVKEALKETRKCRENYNDMAVESFNVQDRIHDFDVEWNETLSKLEGRLVYARLHSGWDRKAEAYLHVVNGDVRCSIPLPRDSVIESFIESFMLAAKSGTTAQKVGRLPKGWTRKWQQKESQYYYVNSDTGREQWNFPRRHRSTNETTEEFLTWITEMANVGEVVTDENNKIVKALS